MFIFWKLYVLPWGQMSLWGNFVPQMADLDNNLLISLNTLPFIKPKTRAQKRIGRSEERRVGKEC